MENELGTGVGKILEYLNGIPLSKSTIKYYKSCYCTIMRYCQDNGIIIFSTHSAEEFNKHQQLRLKNGEITLIYSLIMRKAAITLAKYLEDGVINWRRRYYHENSLCPHFEELLNAFETSLAVSLSEGSVDLVVQTTRQFLKFLKGRNYCKINQVKTEDVRDFIIQSASRHKGNMVNLTWPVKRFFNFLNDYGYSGLDVSRLLANPVPARKKVLPCFSQAELDELFRTVDTSTALGKRDYAIMRLALGVGLRAADIINLRLSDINWRKNEIVVLQQKTGTRLVLPLLPDVGNAIADYILNTRPSSDNPYIFLRNRMPYDKLGRGAAGANIIKRYQSQADLQRKAGDGKTFHAFRRTAGTRLIEADVPLTTAAQILGHKNIDSSKRYISLNDEMLRVCCLDISEYETTKEGLA